MREEPTLAHGGARSERWPSDWDAVLAPGMLLFAANVSPMRDQTLGGHKLPRELIFNALLAELRRRFTVTGLKVLTKARRRRKT